MKVLMITMAYPDFRGSYRGIFIQRLCITLKKMGIEPIVLTPRVFSSSPLYEMADGIPIYRFWYPSGNRPLNQVSGVPILPMLIFMVSGFSSTLYLVCRYRPQIIHGNWIVPTGLIAALAGKLTCTPIINTARGMDTRISKKGPIKRLFDLAVRLSDGLSVVSEPMRTISGLEQAVVIPSGADDIFFAENAAKRQSLIVFTRSLEKIYDCETLLRAVPLVIKEKPNARFIIAGAGAQESHLKRLTTELGIKNHVHFSGMISQTAIAELMQQAKVYVSTAIEDGTSIALLEAFGSGLVPVVTDIAANRAWITHNTDGYLFQPGNEKDLSIYILKALKDGIDKETLDKKREKTRQNISLAAVAKQFICIYTQLVNKAGGTKN